MTFLKQNNMKTVLITGATGFIGNNIVKSLVSDENFILVILVRKNSNISKLGPLNDRSYIIFAEDLINNSISNFKIDVVIHLATYYINNHNANQVEELISSNITLGISILETFKFNPNSIFINFTSSSIFANSDKYFPQTLYSATKKAFSNILEFYKNKFNFYYIELIIYDTYGKGDSRNKLLSQLIGVLQNNEILQLSPGEQRIRLLHIDDLVDAVRLLIDSRENLNKNEVNYFTLGPEETYSVREIVRLIEELTNKKINVHFGARDYRHNEIMIPYPIKRYPTGWKPKIMLPIGLKEIIDEKK